MIIQSIPRSVGTFCLLILLTRDAQGLSSLFQTPNRVNHLRLSRQSKCNVQSRNFAGINRISPQKVATWIPQEGEDVIETLHESLTTEGSGNKLLWTCILLAIAQLSAGNESFSTVLVSPKSFAFSTVSASLLRKSGPNRELSGKKIVTFAFLACQTIVQARSLASVGSAAFSKCSSWYIGCLASNPLYTKACTSAVIGLIGDTIAQYVEERRRITAEGKSASFRKYDRRRGLSMVADGLFVTGPLLHVVYDFMEAQIPVSGSFLPPSAAALAQVLIDDIFVDALFVAITYISTGITEGHGTKTLSYFKKDYVRTVKTGWITSVLLMPLEFVCFRFLPVSLRVLGMNFVDIIWDGVLSFQVHKSRIRNDDENQTTEAIASTATLAFAAQ